MRRLALVVSAVVAVAVAVLVVGLLHRGGGNPVVATVGKTSIKRRQLDLMVDHFHEESDREGRPFPAPGSPAYKEVQRAALRLLIDRASVESAAARLGVHVSDAEVEARLATAAGGESEGGGDIRVEAEAAFRRATVRSQLITEAVFRRLTARVAVSSAAIRGYFAAHRRDFPATTLRKAAPVIRAQLLAARKNAVYARWLAKVRRTEPKPKL
jgi:hypothetical protein